MTATTAPTDVLADLTRHVGRVRTERIRARLAEAEDAGALVNLTPPMPEGVRLVREGMADVLAALGEPVHPPAAEGPVFPEVEAPLLGAPSGLGSLCAIVNDAIAEYLAQYDVRSGDLRSTITSGAMVAGNADQALAYLLRWVNFEMPED